MNRQLKGSMAGPQKVARALGWFSVALGVAELVAPRAVARACGMSGRDAGVVRAYGLRELAAGAGLLKTQDPAPWLWTRVAGDVLDIATVGLQGRGRSGRMTFALATLAGVAVLDVMAARQAQQRRTPGPTRDYSDRSGFPRPAAEMRGVASHHEKRPRRSWLPEALNTQTLTDRASG